MRSVGNLLRELEERIEARTGELEQRIAKLEATLEQSAKALAFRGNWTGGQYQRGNLVSCGGAIYFCDADTDAKPGSDCAWTLIVPKPRDGRDGKDLR